MSDANVIVKNSVSFSDYLKVKHGPNGHTLAYYQRADAEEQRTIAVSCALELIRAELSGPNGYDLLNHMKALPEYADIIQEALKVNTK